MKLLLGTANPAKLDDYKKFLVRSDLELVSLKDINFLEEPLEIGQTFEENALQKARFYAERTEYPALSDDGGFEVDALEGMPGVESNRWLGPDATDEDKINKILLLLQGLPEKERVARLKFVVVVYFPAERDYVQAEGLIEGFIPEMPSSSRVKGFPYRSLLFLPQLNKYFVDLDETEHLQLNYRNTASRQLLMKIEPYLN